MRLIRSLKIHMISFDRLPRTNSCISKMFRYIGNFLKKKAYNPMTLSQILVKSKSSLFEGKLRLTSVIEIEQVDYSIKETVAFRHVYMK